MELTHDFTVPGSMEDTWAALNDIEGVAGCFPGASVTSVEGDTFKGSCKVKLGPVSLTYQGSGSFVDKDESARTMRIEASGKDKRGNGAANADVAARMEETQDGTRVTVTTVLEVTGKPAQFGRGMMQDVSDKLLAQFVDCLARRVGDAGEAPPAEQGTAAGASTAVAAAGAASADGGPAAAGGEAPTGAGGAEADGTPGAADLGARAAPPPAAAPVGGGRHAGPARESGDSLDLGATVLPVLVKNYGKQAAAAAVVALLLVWLVRRLH